MRRRIVPAAVLLFIAVAARAQPRGAVDWVFLIDTSKSMRGIGGEKKFPHVKASIAPFVREAGDGGPGAIFSFFSPVRLPPAAEVFGAARGELVRNVDAPQGDG